ncbi:M14 family zinc carboxypeptidase [Candidatus Neomarinimicrobiota bacterium]
MRLIVLILLSYLLMGQIPLKYNENISPTYNEAISWYKHLDKKYKKAKLITYGLTDIGKPLHLLVISSDKDFNPNTYRSKGKCMIMINNAIHPGEPCGVDASIKFAEDLLRDNKIPKNVIIGIIPAYNIGGVLNRNSTTRANQNGPEEYGFRGNARNLDLNRDFIKLDSENAKSITKIFHEWNPDFFIDTHTTNGADYQHIMTLIGSHPLNFPQVTQDFVKTELLPNLYLSMDKFGFPMVPYVSPVKRTPDSGLLSGISSPRYSNGYGILFNTFSFISEAHMFKTYAERVESTIAFLNTVLDFAKTNATEVIALRLKANESIKSKEVFTLTWKTDTTKFDLINFYGYEAEYKPSKVTGFDRLYYNRDKPWTKQIPVYNYFTPGIQVTRPDYYVLPQAWGEVIERLELNNIKFKRLCKDTVITGKMYIIKNIANPSEPFNGHFLHSKIELKTVTKSSQYYKGDILIPMNQIGNRYLVEVLEPQARDSFFRWNFFDSILDQREYFSPYIFEDTAEKMLMEDEELRKEFEEQKSNDEDFAKDARAQLYWLYKRSPNFEADYRLYPVMRVMD